MLKMKKYFVTPILILIAGYTLTAQDQLPDSLGLPGDNLNLYAVMELFQESETLEAFEKSLNDENSNINNLDLNSDDKVDYIRVFDDADGDIHNIVLQISLSENENQDVAVFTVQRDADENVQIQLTGDEALYGKDYILEPNLDAEVSGQTPNPGYTGKPSAESDAEPTTVQTTTVVVNAWPVVRYIYMPSYVAWHSPWYFGYYPPYWNPWRPHYWHYYYGFHYHRYVHYHTYYRATHYHRSPGYSRYYSQRRTVSVSVNNRVRAGQYKTTYSKPSQRIQGEARYNKMNPNQRRNMQGTATSSDRPAKSSATRTEPAGKSNATTTGRRSASGTKKSTTNESRPSSNNKSTVKRSSTGSSGQSNRKPSTGKNVSSSKTKSHSPSSGSNKSSRSSNSQNKSRPSTKPSKGRR